MPDFPLQLIATTAFGLEKVAARELEQLGYQPRVVRPGRLQFAGDAAAIARTNIQLRTAERIMVLLAEFAAPDFDSLFDTIKALPLEDWIPVTGAFPVSAKSIRSQLSSVPAIQRSVKKAAAQRLLQAHGCEVLPETGPLYALEAALLNDHLQLTLDTTGDGLHKRGYRPESGRAPLRETMAAALVLLSHWRTPASLMDPFCGTGTILIEAAMIGRRIAPGLKRQFTAEGWDQVEPEVWQAARKEAQGVVLPALDTRLAGFDLDEHALQLARRNAMAAGVENDIHFQQRPFHELHSSHEFGCVITNPPYGLRIDDPGLRQLYESFPLVLRQLPTWSHFILTGYEGFEQIIGQQATRRRKLYNGRIECQYYQFLGPKKDANQVVFGGVSDRALHQADLFRARLTNHARHLRRWPKRGITCFRIYDKDVPEIPLMVDRYEEHVVIYEAGKSLTRTPAEQADWMDLMAQVASEVLQVDRNKVFLKQRRRQDPTTQYARASRTDERVVVNEGGLKFGVNLQDYVDTGLYLDHRVARQLVRGMARDKRVLNLFSYTGAFSVYAAVGGASQVTSVDLSPNYLRWAQDNFRLNQLNPLHHAFVQADVATYIHDLPRHSQFDLVIIDAPTFSNSKRVESDWSVQEQHVPLLQAVETHLSDDAVVLFSVHFRRFKNFFVPAPPRQLWEISARTVPDDFRDRRTHRCWWIGARPPRVPAGG